MTRARFRNVEADPAAPVETWPLEALRAVLERGDLADYRRVAAGIAADPWGPVARRVEDILGYSAPYGAAPLMRRVIDQSRERAELDDREWVCRALRASVVASGLTQAEFAARLGTSASRLSTYLSGRVVPAATVLARAEAVAKRMRAAR